MFSGFRSRCHLFAVSLILMEKGTDLPVRSNVRTPSFVKGTNAFHNFEKGFPKLYDIVSQGWRRMCGEIVVQIAVHVFQYQIESIAVAKAHEARYYAFWTRTICSVCIIEVVKSCPLFLDILLKCETRKSFENVGFGTLTASGFYLWMVSEFNTSRTRCLPSNRARDPIALCAG